MKKKKLSLSIQTNVSVEDNNTQQDITNITNTSNSKLQQLLSKTQLISLDSLETNNTLIKIKDYFEGRNLITDISYEW